LKTPRLILTPGEPAGIGPDIILQIAQQDWPAELVVITDPALLSDRAGQLGITIKLEEAKLADRTPTPHQAGTLKFISIPLAAPVKSGKLDTANALFVQNSLAEAARLCLEHQADAIVTGPVHKGVMNDAGIAFSGHTEFFAQQSNVSRTVMLFVTGKMRVALATTHLPLADVAKNITAKRLRETLEIINTDLKNRIGVSKPRILVCGLNPHAGEGGHLGREEIEVITPLISQLQSEGLSITGPLPADTLFTPKYLAQADVVLAMYHDQALPLVKYASFGHAVNVTLGLPFIRTSVDHGTALDIAGSGQADSGSMKAAIELAINYALTQPSSND
jgi:4-hydroxythreonine-4-phosphate dehydrogenase